MAKYRLKPVEVEAITFDEFVEYGKNHSTNLVNGIPWSFDYKGCAVSHENNSCYIVCTPEWSYHFTPNDILVTDSNGDVEMYKCHLFNEIWEIVKESNTDSRLSNLKVSEEEVENFCKAIDYV